MARRRKTKKKKERRRKPERALPFRGPIPSEVRDRIESLLEDDREGEALVVIEEWLERRPDHPDLCFYAGCAHAALGHLPAAMSSFRRAHRQDQRNISILYNLIFIYVQLKFPIHALRAVSRYLQAGASLEDDDGEHLGGLRAALGADQRATADELDLDREQHEAYSYWNEEAQIGLEEGDFTGAIAAAGRALRIFPDQASARNNRATAYYFAGDLGRAIAEEERVLEKRPEDLHALTNLTRFCCYKGADAEMRRWFERLREVPEADWARQSQPLEKMVEAYGVAGSHEEVYAFLETREDALSDQGLYVLGAAAANLGKTREARRVWKKMGPEPSPWLQLAEGAGRALDAGRRGPGAAPFFPYTVLPELITSGQLKQLTAAMEASEAEEPGRKRPMADIVSRHPAFLHAARWVLWHGEDQVPHGLHLLATLGTDEAWAEIRRFALGQDGTDQERMEALQFLREGGRLDEDEAVRVWIKGEWREVVLKEYEVNDAEGPPPYSDEVLKLIVRAEAAQDAGEEEEAEGVLCEILELDPHCTHAYVSLAEILRRRGDREAARACIERGLEHNPDDGVGICVLAYYHLLDGEREEAEGLIRPLSDRKAFTPEEMRIYQVVQVMLKILDGELDDASRMLAELAKVHPDDPALEELGEALDDTRYGADHFRQLDDTERSRLERLYARHLDEGASLETCLDRNTKEDLQTISRRLAMEGVSAFAKADLVSAVADRLRDGIALRRALDRLSDRAREALDHLLAHDGLLPWESFAEIYGDELNDPKSPKGGPRARPPMAELRLTGLLCVGSRDRQRWVQVPAELRALIQEARDGPAVTDGLELF